MDSLAMILLTIPVFFPLIMNLDFGMTAEETAIWFGILTLIVVEGRINYTTSWLKRFYNKQNGWRCKYLRYI
jgi:hypothetical protein